MRFKKYFVDFNPLFPKSTDVGKGRLVSITIEVVPKMRSEERYLIIGIILLIQEICVNA
jgi:hypothetical protein